MSGRKHIRTLSIVIGIFVLIVMWAGQSAYAQVASTKQNTRVMQRKGEKSRVIKRLPAGKKVRVLSREGQWAKIRVDGQTGWVKASALTSPERSDSRRKSRFGRSGKEGTAPTDRVGADAVDGAKRPPGDKGKSGDGSADRDDGDDGDDGAGDGDDDGGADATKTGDDGTSKSGDPTKTDPDANPDVTRTAAKSALRRLGEEEPKKPNSNDSTTSDGDDGDDGDDDDDDDGKSVSLDTTMVVKANSVVMRRTPKKQGKELQTLYKGAQLRVLARSSNSAWYLVEDSNGDQGWIPSSSVKRPGGSYPPLMLRTRASGGFTSVSQRFFSDGGPNYELSRYDIQTGAAAVRVGGDVVYHVSPWLIVGGDLSYDNTFASPGIAYQDGNGNQTQTAFMMHEINAGGSAGVDFQNAYGMLAYARVGYYYGLLGVKDYDDPNVNLARLPSEIMRSLIVGGRVEVARLAGPVGLNVGGDIIVPATSDRVQTEGLRDGQLVTAEGFWSGAQVNYRLASLNVEAGYRFAFAKTIWKGVAERPTGAIRNAFRKDYTHIISIGVGKAF